MNGTPLRFAVVFLLFVVLAGLFVWAGTVEPDSTADAYPDTEAVHQNPDRYVGERVTVAGTVVDTDPMTVESELAPGQTRTFVVENYEGDAVLGEYYRIFGTLQSNGHVDATDTVDRGPWEMYYMYLVSSLAGVWILARFYNGWTVDTTTWTLVPRTEPLVELRT